MWHKRHREEDAAAPAGKRLRDNLTDLFNSGAVGGERAQSLLEDAGAFAREVGRPDMQDLRAHRSTGSSRNIARDLRTRLLRRSQWPPMYVQEMRFWDPKQKRLVSKKVALLLPHEVVGKLAQAGDLAHLVENAGLDAVNRKKHQQIFDSLQHPFISLSLWGDGVPYSWDRKKSVEVWTLSLPGLALKRHRDIRIPLVGVPAHFVCRESHDDILSVLSWSPQALASGLYPEHRPDGLAWTTLDTWRKKKAGSPLPYGALVEIKGDWKQLHAVFGVPSWTGGQHKPICWRCTCTKTTLREESGHASSWLQEPNRLNPTAWTHLNCGLD